MSREAAAVVVTWAGKGIEEDPWRPNLPDLPAGVRWEDISTVNGQGIPGGSQTYTIRVTADSTFIDQLESEPGLVVEWREKRGAERQHGARAGTQGFVNFAVELVLEGLYKDLASVVQIFGLDTNKTWGQVAVEGIVNQVALANGVGPAMPPPILNQAQLEALL